MCLYIIPYPSQLLIAK